MVTSTTHKSTYTTAVPAHDGYDDGAVAFYTVIVILIAITVAAALFYYCTSCCPAMLKGSSTRTPSQIPLIPRSSP